MKLTQFVFVWGDEVDEGVQEDGENLRVLVEEEAVK